ncbi:MAG: hypothetical protein KJ638_08585, partial [Chloroflexi bacterium]|nr:hypothetical protein [Chloroflexota bacterium]
IFGWLLARTKIRVWLAGVVLLLAGIVVVFVLVGDLLGPLVALYRAAYHLIWEFLRRAQDVPVDTTLFQLAYAEVYSGVAALLSALWEWGQYLVDGPPIFDLAAISLVWGAALWVIASWAGWVQRRYRRPLASILPAGALLTIGLSYTSARTAALLPMIFATLVLVALTDYKSSENSWQSSGMDFPEDIHREVAYVVITMAASLVVAAVIMPRLSISKIVDSARQLTQPQIEDAQPLIESFGLMQQGITEGGIGKVSLTGGLPRSHLLGTGPELSEKVVMTVQISGGLPAGEDENEYLALPLYWRSLVYDRYTGSGWKSSDIATRFYEPGEQAFSPGSPVYRVIQQDFRLTADRAGFLYAAGTILSADDDFEIAWRPTPKYTAIFKAPGDFFGASIEHLSYRVQSLVPVVSEADLRAAPDEYPVWIQERHLALPDTVPQRVFDLARDLTAYDTTAYDRVRSLEGYLRTFEYSLDLPAPPPDRDVVDYFLFDLKRGYCDYYATALAVMSRSIGIPARLVTGYVRGIYDADNERYIVTEADAHSWVEIYFPEIGWIPFEPTEGRSVLGGLSQQRNLPSELDASLLLEPLPTKFEQLQRRWTAGLLILVSGLSSCVLGYFWIDNWRLRRFSPPKAVENLYRRLYRHGRRLAAPARVGDTPHEFAASLGARLASLSQDTIWRESLMPAADEIRDLTDTYAIMLYSPLSIDISDRVRIISLWKRLRRRLWLARWIKLTGIMCQVRRT